MSAPQQWYHLIASAYGAWLYGDSRGFRTRHHREHVEGDYKNPPPPGTYAAMERRSRASLKQPPVLFPSEFREVVGYALLEKLESQGALVACVAVGGRHVHVLARMPFGKPRTWMGVAKRHAWFVLRERGWKEKLWGKRGKALPVRDRAHQLNVYRYIMNHAKQGAWVWTMLSRKKNVGANAEQKLDEKK